MDKILMEGIGVRCIIGVNRWERMVEQKVSIDVELHGNFRRAARLDKIADAVDYKELCDRIVAFVRGSRFSLIETLAERIAGICLESGKVRKVRVRLSKPGALADAERVGVEFVRRRVTRTAR